MATNSNFPKGSEWRKWDLHVHSLYTNIQNNYGNSTEDQFINKIKEADIKVIGLTNYFNFSKKDFSLKEKLEKAEIKVFLNLELRLTYQNKEDECCDIHVIFDDEIEESKIQQFLSNLTINVAGTDKKANQIKSPDDYIKGAVEFDKLRETLDDNSLGLKGQYLIGFLSRGKGNSRSSTVYEKIAISSHFLIHSTSKLCRIYEDRKYWLDKNKPVIKSSDSHSIDTIGSKFTWIKADPTFEGLKQILYEPEERVRIQETNPEYDFDKPTFSKIIINKPIEVFQDEKVKFDKISELPLNKNLVTIIGGRGTGKSLLLNYVANTFNKEILAYKNKDKQVHFSISRDFQIEWQKNNKEVPETLTFNCEEKGSLDFIFIEQGKLKNISNPRILSDEIKKLLGIEKLQFDEELDQEISLLLDEIEELKKWFDYENEKREKINDRKFNERKKDEAQKLLETITTQENKNQLKKYTSNVKKINDIQNIIINLETLRSSLSEFLVSTNDIIKDINSKIKDDINDISIYDIDFKVQIEQIDTLKFDLEKLLKSKQEENNVIIHQFENKGFKGDLVILFSNAEKYQIDIEDAENKLIEIEKQENLLNEKINLRNKLGEKLKSEYERQQNQIKNAWDNLLKKFSEQQKIVIKKILEGRNISITGVVKFDINKFDEKLKEYLDLRTYKNLSKDLNINNIDDYWNFIEKDLPDFIDGSKINTTKKSLDQLCLNLMERREYLYVLPEIKFMDKNLDQLSVGQRGTLYLLLQLATNTFSSPLIFDQPEDDLDNNFITQELVGLFKDLKNYRQIIISTHNANLVVTADAEQVIVANNNDETLSYFSGSLENSEIIKSVCQILEGGKDAFEKRRNRYHTL